jgi:hypothetical protein
VRIYGQEQTDDYVRRFVKDYKRSALPSRSIAPRGDRPTARTVWASYVRFRPLRHLSYSMAFRFTKVADSHVGRFD